MSITSRIIKTIGVFSGVQAAGILCSVVRAKFISLWIGPAGVGLFAIFNNIITLMSTATQLNLRQSAVRDISTSPQARLPFIAGVVRWWGCRLGVAGAVLMLALSPLLSIASFGDTSRWWAFAALSVGVFALSVASGEQAVMQGTGALRRLARSTVLTAVTATAVALPLYYLFGEASIIPTILIFAIASMAYTTLMRDTPSAPATLKQNIEQGKGFLRLGSYLTVSAVAATAASYIFVSYLNRTESESATGIFQAGYTLVIQYTGIIFTAISMEYFPRISQIADRPGMASVALCHEINIILYILTPLLVLFVAADELALRLLYSSEFIGALPFVTVGIGAMVFRAVSYCMAYVIVGRGDGRTYIVTEVASSAIGLGLNITLFHFRGFAGLGISYVLWYMIYTAMVWTVCHRYGLRLSARTVRLFFSATAITATAIFLKPFGWWAVLPMLIPALWLALHGLRSGRKHR